MAVADLSVLIPKSEFIKSFEWTGELMPYPDPEVRGDTYPMTWAAFQAAY